MTLTLPIKSLLIASTVSLFITACGGSSNSSKSPNQSTSQNTNQDNSQTTTVFDYQALIDGVVDHNVPGVILRVDTGQTQFVGSAGVTDTDTLEPMQNYHQQPTASAGKPMISLLVAMLAEEGLLNIDDTLDTWLDEEILERIENSRQMTLRQLLNHSAGVFNFVDDEAYITMLLEEPERYKSTLDFLPIAYDKPAQFSPGADYSYSNTGYLLASLVVDKLFDEHHSVALRERILNPLALNSTYYRGIEKSLGDFIQGYHVDDGERYLTKAHHENIATANDPVVSSVEDMGRFLKALVTDTSFISDEVRELMWGEQSLMHVDDQVYYGLGISLETFQDTTAYAHAGLNYGYRTVNIYVKEKDLTITAFINCSTEPYCTDAMDIVVNNVIREHF
ncbi:beta-lactamase family protein [Thalassotalea sp. M1531]|uniref:Beta-lactamase family protein n=1 Tax=Thalassotalea algicola TaxID=2716224 RepID=A0A7Y0Q6B3_9GAMM|nr:serine hydrolase domain-containing protein [Thalassotalea algicola]NMP31834.1 beta-lactamase family protein [Thalassotalea algicola]